MTEPEARRNRSTTARYRREGTGLSFERVAFFSDAVFAIALTLIVVGIGVPVISQGSDSGELWSALWGQRTEIISFFVGVLVIGFYWRSNHLAVEELDAVDSTYVALTIPYLALVAFLPFPISLVGSYDENPVSWAAFSLNLAAVSGMETVLLAHAQRADLVRLTQSPAQQRWERWMSLLPVPVFLASIALAFVQPWLTPVGWACAPPLQAILTQRTGPRNHD